MLLVHRQVGGILQWVVEILGRVEQGVVATAGQGYGNHASQLGRRGEERGMRIGVASHKSSKVLGRCSQLCMTSNISLGKSLALSLA